MREGDLRRTLEAALTKHREGKLLEAAAHYERVLTLEPSHEQALFLSAAIALETGRADEGKRRLEQLIERFPHNAVYWTNLGEAYRRGASYEQAATALARAVTLKPDLAPAHFNLALVARQLGEHETALSAFERAAELKPEDAQVQHGLAKALVHAGQHARALGHFQCALITNPSRAEPYVDYAACLRHLGRLDAARVAAARAVSLAPESWLGHHEESAVASEQGRFDDALAASRRAIALSPSSALAHTGLAAALADTGQLEDALATYRRVVDLDPANHIAHSNIVFLEAFRHGSTAASIAAEARAWSERQAASFSAHVREHDNVPAPERRLRVGYVSSNYNSHCQALFTLPVLAHHDREAFEVVGYSATARTDATTHELSSRFDRFFDISALGPVEAAELIRSHRIDILVDLTMHMAECQLRTFACKPAPVQIAWLAYPGTTGLAAMDYRVTDRHLDPPDAPQGDYSEESLALPDTFWCYAPRAALELSELPAKSNGFVTFGCFNSFWKLNEPTLELWARVLGAVPGSRLLLLAPEGRSRERIDALFGKQGVERARLGYVTRRPRSEYLKLYHQVDVCLDTLPYNGHTTSLDSFWMGVPVVSLVGSTVVGRAGLCQAENLELPELATLTREDFVARAASLASDLGSLAEMRATLRGRLERSPLMDAPRFTQNLEDAYRSAWQRWCGGRS
jgi:protein O-GlcNAc transferase